MNASTVYLTQTDTTVGFVSQDNISLSLAKQRNINQPSIICVSSHQKQKKLARVPKKFRKKVRRTKQTTFLYSNKKAIRVVKSGEHHAFLKKFFFQYSSSANKNNANFKLDYAKKHSDVWIETFSGYKEQRASSILKLGKNKIHKLR